MTEFEMMKKIFERVYRKEMAPEPKDEFLEYEDDVNNRKNIILHNWDYDDVTLQFDENGNLDIWD